MWPGRHARGRHRQSVVQLQCAARLRRRARVQPRRSANRPHSAAGSVRQSVFRRPQARPPVHGCEPVALSAPSRNTRRCSRLNACHGNATTKEFHMLLRVPRAAALMGILSIAAGSQISAAASSAEILLAQGQSAPQPQNVESSIATLRQRLQITPAQEAQFNAVANVMRENARTEGSALQQPPAGATAVDDLRAYIRYSEVELAGLKKMLP